MNNHAVPLTHRQTGRHADRQWGCCCCCCCCSGNPSPRSSSRARRAAGRYLCALPSCHPRHWSTKQTHVGAYPTNLLFSTPTGRLKSRRAAGQPRQLIDPLLQLRRDGARPSSPPSEWVQTCFCWAEVFSFLQRAQEKICCFPSALWAGGGGREGVFLLISICVAGWRSVM